jgi:hypothetical protein
VVIIATSQPAFASLSRALGPDHVVIDLAGCINDPSTLKCRYEGICW